MYWKTIFSFVLFFIVLVKPTHAYLDPGSGSFMFQMAIGALLGGLVTVKIYFQKIRIFIMGLLKRKDHHGPGKQNP